MVFPVLHVLVQFGDAGQVLEGGRFRRRGKGVEALLDAIAAALPESPPPRMPSRVSSSSPPFDLSASWEWHL